MAMIERFFGHRSAIACSSAVKSTTMICSLTCRIAFAQGRQRPKCVCPQRRSHPAKYLDPEHYYSRAFGSIQFHLVNAPRSFKTHNVESPTGSL
jgi:predicted nucleic acid-binding Zn ribbon protein